MDEPAPDARTGEVDLTDDAAFEAEIATLREQASWVDLARAHAARGDLVTDAAEAVRCHLEAARLWEEEVGSAGQARDALRRVLELDPGNAAATAGLEALFRAHE